MQQQLCSCNIYQQNRGFFSEISSYFDTGLGKKKKLKGNFIESSLFHLQQLRILDIFHCAHVHGKCNCSLPSGFCSYSGNRKKTRFGFQSTSLPITVPVAAAAPQTRPPHPQFLPSFLLGFKPEKCVALHLHSQIIITGLRSTPLFLSSALLCDELNALEAGNTEDIFLQLRCHLCVGTCNSLCLL